MAWVELEQALGAGDGGIAVAGSRTLYTELLTGGDRQGAQSFAFEQRPLLKRRAVAQGKPVEKVARVACGSGSKLPGGQVGFKLRNIQIDPGIGG